MTRPAGSSRRSDAYATMLDTVERHPPVTLQEVVDVAWDALANADVSWIGFYRYRVEQGDLILEACRDRPACSPIGLHGVCGQAHLSQHTRLVDDVAALGEDYVACDPADRSEIVVPCRRDLSDGTVDRLVLDLDSAEFNAFSDMDDRAIRRYLELVGLAVPHAGSAWIGGIGGDPR